MPFDKIVGADLEESLHGCSLKVCQYLSGNSNTIFGESGKEGEDLKASDISFTVIESSTEALVSLIRIVEGSLLRISKFNRKFHS